MDFATETGGRGWEFGVGAQTLEKGVFLFGGEKLVEGWWLWSRLMGTCVGT